MTKPLLLTGPYGWDERGHYISLTGYPTNTEKFIDLLKEYSCHAPAIPKIMELLRLSNRYDCKVQYSWFKHSKLVVTERMKLLGVTLSVQEENNVA